MPISQSCEGYLVQYHVCDTMLCILTYSKAQSNKKLPSSLLDPTHPPKHAYTQTFKPICDYSLKFYYVSLRVAVQSLFVL